MPKLSGWQKAGLFAGIGCLSLVAVAVVGLLVAVAWARSTLNGLGDPTPVAATRTIALPPPASGAAAGDALPMHLTVELAGGDFTIRPGAPGSGVQVQGTWAPGLYELTETVVPAANGGAARATIRFASKAPAWARVFGGMFGRESASRSELTLTIPRETPIDLVLNVAMGESRIDLGGLMLRDLELALAMGEHRVNFAEPVAAGMRRIQLNASMGNVEVENVGNTRAPVVEANGSMGNLSADLGGAWSPGAVTQVSFDHSMGELVVRVPTAVGVETTFNTSMGSAENRGSNAPQTDDPNAAVLKINMSTSMGEGRVVRY